MRDRQRCDSAMHEGRQCASLERVHGRIFLMLRYHAFLSGIVEAGTPFADLPLESMEVTYCAASDHTSFVQLVLLLLYPASRVLSAIHIVYNPTCLSWIPVDTLSPIASTKMLPSFRMPTKALTSSPESKKISQGK